jgi:F-type H+-transporting ATPase subunit epsilon
VPESIELEIITSTGIAVKTSIRELYIPAFYGEAGILENHLPYISLLNFGEVSYRDENDRKHYFFVQDGFMESAKNKITIVSDSVEKGEDLDKADTETRYADVSKKIESSLTGDITPQELDEALIEKKKLQVKIGILKKLSKG